MIPLIETQTSSETTQPSPPTNTIGVPLTISVYNNLKLIPIFLSPVNIDEKKDRYKICAIFCILTFEILKSFDEVLLAINESSDDGVLLIFWKRIFIIFLIGCQYSSILISIRLEHFQNQSIRRILIGLLRLFYIIVLIAYRIYRESICLDFLPHSDNFSAIDEIQLRFTLGNWFLFYGSVTNLPYFIFLSYIAAEFSTYSIFDLFSKNEKKEEKESLQKPVQIYNDRVDNRTSFEKFRDRIYKWDEKFLFSTLMISTYTVNFIILFHLLHTFIFLYTTRQMAPISFIINIFEEILQIQIKETLFHIEICLSAVSTAIIYGIQLFLGLKNFRHHIKISSEKSQKKFIEDTRISEKEARSKAIQYPGYLIRYTFGGFIITFHLLIFILFLPRLLVRFLVSFQWIYELLIPIVILYLLQFLIVRLCTKMININHNEESSSKRIGSTQESCKENLRNILQYLILVANCFIGIMSSIILLIKAILFNILCMNRTDSCLFPEAFEKLDSANMAYWCFVYEQISCVQNVLPDDLPKPSPPSKDKEIDGYKFSYEAAEEYSVNTSSFDKNIWTGPFSLRQNWDMINRKRSSNESSKFPNAKQQLHAIGLKKVTVPGDGNCFFRAVAAQLNQHENQHLEIRSQAIEYLKSHRHYFKQFIDRTTDATMETYIQQMSQNRTYVDHITILATAAAIQRNIIIHSKDQTPWLIPSFDSSHLQLHLWYDSNREPYDRVVSPNGNSLYLPPAQLLQT